MMIAQTARLVIIAFQGGREVISLRAAHCQPVILTIDSLSAVLDIWILPVLHLSSVLGTHLSVIPMVVLRYSSSWSVILRS